MISYSALRLSLGVCLWGVSRRCLKCIYLLIYVNLVDVKFEGHNFSKSIASLDMHDLHPSSNIEKLFTIGLDPGKMEKLDRKCLSSRKESRTETLRT